MSETNESTNEVKEERYTYVLSRDGVPLTFSSNLKKLKENLNEKVLELTTPSSSFRYFCEYENDDNSVSVFSRHNFFVVSYDSLLTKLDITKVKRLD